MEQKKRKYLPKKNRTYIPICSNEIVAKLWGCKTENIRLEYQSNQDKQIQYSILDAGAFCIQNNITGEMLKSLVQFGNSFLTDEEAQIVAKLREQRMNQELNK
jgi:hypothetical protein